MSERGTTQERAIRMACRAANLAQLAACYREEAEHLIREARELDPDSEWSVDPDGLSPRGLPENWMAIGENP